MQNAAQAYGKVAKQTSSPRELEADLLLQAAARLQAVTTTGTAKRAQLDDALLYNRKLWTIFLTSVTDSDNPLPTAIRQNVANLGLFVMNQTRHDDGRSAARAARLADQHQSRARRRPARPRLSARTATRIQKPRGDAAGFLSVMRASVSSEIVEQMLGLVEHRGGLQRGLQAGLQRQDLRRDFFLRRLSISAADPPASSCALLARPWRPSAWSARRRARPGCPDDLLAVGAPSSAAADALAQRA